MGQSIGIYQLDTLWLSSVLFAFCFGFFSDNLLMFLSSLFPRFDYAVPNANKYGKHKVP